MFHNASQIRSAHSVARPMDHIPLPKNPTWGRIEIPCIAEEGYDGGPYERYPARQGYMDQSLHK